MEKFNWTESPLPRDLGDGLALRFSTHADTERVAQFYGRVFGDKQFDEMAAVWTRDFMSDAHPTGGVSNLTLVEDTNTGQIASAMCLIPQTWTFAGIPFEVGRPEVVATDAAYRRRGLVRAQFEVLHAKSAAMGHLVQAITGIPWYYRQFGYEYALDLGGGRWVYLPDIHPLKAGETEAYHIRPMTLDDVPFVAPLYERECARLLVTCLRPAWLWHCMFAHYSPASSEYRHFRIVETPAGRPVGYFVVMRDIWQKGIAFNELAVVAGQSLRAIMPAVLREAKRIAELEAAGQKKTVAALNVCFDSAHPVYRAIQDYPFKTKLNYGWYIRVADVPRFVRHIAPVLEARLANSPMAGHTGELKISEFTNGLRLVFDKGKITTAETWNPIGAGDPQAFFPPLVFLQLLFGFRSLQELRVFWPDVWAQDEAHILLDSLFPRQESRVMPVG